MGLFDALKKLIKGTESKAIEPSSYRLSDTEKEIYSKEGLDIGGLQKLVLPKIGRKLTGKELVVGMKEENKEEDKLARSGAIVENLIGPLETGPLERVVKGREELKEEREMILKQYPESRQFFESVEKEKKEKFTPFGSLLKDKSGMLLKKGDRIVGKGIDSYTLYIPGYNSSRLQKFYGEAKEFVGNTTGEERVQKLMQFVHDNIEHEVGWEGQTIAEQQKHSGIIEKEVSLIRSIFLRKGVCKEQAAVLSMMLRMEGLENEFIRGKPEVTSPLFGSLPMEERGGRHAWVKVKLGNDYYYVDPTNECFEKYDSGLLKYKLHEDSGYYPRSDGTLIKRNENRFTPLGSLLKDTSGTFPRREKEAKNLDEVANELSDIKSEEQSLQELAKKLTLQLAEFWGIPSSLQIQAFVPKVKICGKEEYKKLIGKEDADIGKDVPIATYVKFNWGNAYYHCIVVNREWFSNEFSSGLMYSIKPALAEEIGHFIQNTIEGKTGKPDIFVKEFFGAISRLYIAEQIPELFKGEYRNLFNNAIEFSTKFEEIRNLIRYFESEVQPNNPQLAVQNAENSEKISELKDALDHLAYHPAVAYYYEIRKMSSQERYKLLNMNFTDLKNYIIGPQMRELEGIRLKVMQRKQTAANRERNLQSYPESAQFFEKTEETATIERAASEAIEYQQEQRGYEESGVTSEEVQEPSEQEEYPEEEYQETQEAEGGYEQPEEAQEGQYGPESEQAPQQPKINISIPEKVPKNIAKKLESMGVKLPKKMIKN